MHDQACARRVLLSTLFYLMLAAGGARSYAQDDQSYTFQSLRPEFLRTEIARFYAQY